MPYLPVKIKLALLDLKSEGTDLTIAGEDFSVAF